MQLSDKLKKQSIGWLLISSLIIILLLIPNINILLNLFTDTSENWQHIKKYLLMDYIKNSLILIISTGLLTALIGTLLAWLIAAYEFPGRAFLSWALLLPLAIPPYIGAYTYAGLFSYTGPFQVLLRKRFGLVVNQQYFDFMTMRGAIFIYTIFLFPYVYLLAKSFLAKQSASLVEISCLLGKSATSIFFKVILPVSRGIIVAGASLVMLEVLNDYGVVKYFGIPTFSTAIFKTWFGMGDLTSAVRLAAIAMGVIFILLYLEKLLRGGRQYSYSTSQIRPLKRKKLTGGSKYFATMFSFSIFGLGFIIPVGQLLYWSYLSDGSKWGNLLEYSTGSILTGLLAATLVIIAAIIVANTVRINSGILSNLFARITMLGYSIPGAVIAVGILVFLLQVDQFISWLMQPFAIEINMFLTTSLVMLFFAYLIRFLGIGFNAVNSGYQKIGTKFFEASRTLGKSVTATFFKVDLPMIKPAVLSGFLLVFIEVMKELPLTLILRPFNFNTLATRAFEYAADEMIYRAADLSLILIFCCTIAILLVNQLRKGREDASEN